MDPTHLWMEEVGIDYRKPDCTRSSYLLLTRTEIYYGKRLRKSERPFL